MAPSGSSRGTETDIAERLAEGQRAISIAEFFEKNKHMLGFDSEARALVTAVKEGVDNSLDAGEEAGILPDIYIEVDDNGAYYTLVVEDNGPGITKEQIPKIFGKMLYGSRFHRRQQSLPPDQRVLIRRDGDLDILPVGRLSDSYRSREGPGTVTVDGDIEVPCFNRASRELTWQPVTHVIRHETDESTVKITTQRKRTLEVTANHSLFTVTEAGETAEVDAGSLDTGDVILAPKRLPPVGEPVTEVNLLEHVTPDRLEGRGLSVHGFDRETLANLRSGEVIRKQPSPDSTRTREYYRYNGVEIPRERLEAQYLEHGYLPATTVIELGWAARASECELRAARDGGEAPAVPVSIPVDETLVDLIAGYLSDGPGGDRQEGPTVEPDDRESVTRSDVAVVSMSGATATVERDRKAPRASAVGSPVSVFLASVCGATADEKRIPSFVFRMSPTLQRRFIATLYRDDGRDTDRGTDVAHFTTSQTLARQLAVLWTMHGVVATTTKQDRPGGSPDATSGYVTRVSRDDLDLLQRVEGSGETETTHDGRIPTAVLDPVRVTDVPIDAVPDSIPGLLLGAGVGATLESAKRYETAIEDLVAGHTTDVPWVTDSLKDMGLVDAGGNPTETLHALWNAVTNLHGFTDGDMCLLHVDRVEETDAPPYVYDLSVPGDTGYDENFVVVNDGPLSVKNSRGQQGIGISAAVLYAQLTSGKPARITSRPMGAEDAQYFEVVIDTDENEPDIRDERTVEWDRPHGTRIELDLEANLRARTRLHAYVEQTAVVNPHARIELHEPRIDEPRKFERVTDQLPAETEEIRPHPHGVELGTLIKMLETTDSYSLSGFLQGEFTRVGRKTADEVIDNFRDYHFGRELTWSPPGAHESVDVEAALIKAVTNKGKQATAAFADHVVSMIDDLDRVSHQDVTRIVEEAADRIEEETDRRFGATVRSNAIAAAWAALTDEETDRMEGELYRLVDDATSNRKGDRATRGFAERMADRIRAANRPKHRFTRRELIELVDAAADATESYADTTFGETARENIVEALWTAMRRVRDDPPSVREVANNRDLAAAFIGGMRETDIMAPPTDCLAPITAELIEAGLQKEYDADFYASTTRDASVYGGDPFVVEAGIAYGGTLEEESPVELLRFANRVPLVYQRGACATTDVVREIDWRNYNLDQPGGSGMPSGAMVLLVHVASTNVPFTSESKDAVANIPEIEHEIELAVREVAREVKRHISQRRSLAQRREKEDVIARVLPEIATKVSSVVDRPRPDIDATLARIMNNVHVTRAVEADGDISRVTLSVRNYNSSGADLEVTDIVDVEPVAVPDDADVVAMDDAWYVRWKPTVAAGDRASLTYDAPTDATFDLAVSGVPTEKLTIDQQ